MKKGTIPLLIISAIVLCLIIVVVKSYRNLSTLKEEVKNKETNISVQLSREKEQVNKLIELSRKYIKNEDSFFTELEMLNDSLETADIYVARGKAGINERIIIALNELFDKYNDKALKDEELRTAIGDILSTEKRIDTAVKNFNNAVSEYNSKINSFPASIIASIRGFKKIDIFKVSVKLNNILETK